MNTVIVILCGVTGFLVGFLLGIIKRFPYKTPKRRIEEALSEDLRKLQQEYRNFLEYDGTEQS